MIRNQDMPPLLDTTADDEADMHLGHSATSPRAEGAFRGPLTSGRALFPPPCPNAEVT